MAEGSGVVANTVLLPKAKGPSLRGMKHKMPEFCSAEIPPRVQQVAIVVVGNVVPRQIVVVDNELPHAMHLSVPKPFQVHKYSTVSKHAETLCGCCFGGASLSDFEDRRVTVGGIIL